MEVIGFYGPPGTGKSDRALVIAYENKASCIIDDGILIYHSRIVAGKSAKREESRLKAVRRAIFWDKEQRDEVRAALQKSTPNGCLSWAHRIVWWSPLPRLWISLCRPSTSALKMWLNRRIC